MVRLMGGGMGGFRVRAGLSKCAALIATRIAEWRTHISHAGDLRRLSWRIRRNFRQF
jgi:hypothetical protein